MENRFYKRQLILLIIAFVIVILLGLIILAEDTKAQSFRDLRWGMSLEEVKEIEGEPFIESTMPVTSTIKVWSMAYRESIDDMSVKMALSFYDEELVMGVYMSNNMDDVEELYDQAYKVLTNRHGNPDEEETFMTEACAWYLDETTIALMQDYSEFALIYSEKDFYNFYTKELNKPSEDAEEKF